MKGFPAIKTDLDCNIDDDKEEFDVAYSRLSTINCFYDEGEPKISLTFNMGRKKDDTMSLIFDVVEFTSKVTEAILAKVSEDAPL